jgi:hypothetical protein
MKYPSGGTERASAEDAFELYRNIFARKTGKDANGNTVLEFQVFGRHVFKYKDRASFTLATQLSAEMIGIGPEELKNLDPLWRKDWSLAINDTWLLGGVNGLQEFHPASPLTWKNILDDTHITTVTGRELVGLALAGYQQKQLAIGTVFVPGDTKRAEDLSLVAYDDEVSKLKKQAEVMHFLASKTTWVFE